MYRTIRKYLSEKREQKEIVSGKVISKDIFGRVTVQTTTGTFKAIDLRGRGTASIMINNTAQNQNEFSVIAGNQERNIMQPTYYDLPVISKTGKYIVLPNSSWDLLGLMSLSDYSINFNFDPLQGGKYNSQNNVACSINKDQYFMLVFDNNNNLIGLIVSKEGEILNKKTLTDQQLSEGNCLKSIDGGKIRFPISTFKEPSSWWLNVYEVDLSNLNFSFLAKVESYYDSMFNTWRDFIIESNANVYSGNDYLKIYDLDGGLIHTFSNCKVDIETPNEDFCYWKDYFSFVGYSQTYDLCRFGAVDKDGNVFDKTFEEELSDAFAPIINDGYAWVMFQRGDEFGLFNGNKWRIKKYTKSGASWTESAEAIFEFGEDYTMSSHPGTQMSGAPFFLYDGKLYTVAKDLYGTSSVLLELNFSGESIKEIISWVSNKTGEIDIYYDGILISDIYGGSAGIVVDLNSGSVSKTNLGINAGGHYNWANVYDDLNHGENI
jgi:hypothetical protein